MRSVRFESLGKGFLVALEEGVYILVFLYGGYFMVDKWSKLRDHLLQCSAESHISIFFCPSTIT